MLDPYHGARGFGGCVAPKHDSRQEVQAQATAKKKSIKYGLPKLGASEMVALQTCSQVSASALPPLACLCWPTYQEPRDKPKTGLEKQGLQTRGRNLDLPRAGCQMVPKMVIQGHFRPQHKSSPATISRTPRAEWNEEDRTSLDQPRPVCPIFGGGGHK